ncbi:MAG TPA: DUF2510 domain-containing protein [Pseudolysinimonas sp.]|nr:DUF2510 domain-containing protein [Pseudolysinimonas sp.]
MPDEDVRVPAGWYPDPLGLPQLRWWDNHAWTEHISDARQPMMATETVTAKLAFADDSRPSSERPFADPADEAEQDLSRRERRERERQFDDEPLPFGAADLDPVPPAAAAFADPIRSLEAPERDQVPVDDPAVAFQMAARGILDDAPTSAPFDLDTRFEDLLGETSVPRSASAHVSESASSFVPTASAEQQWPSQPWQPEPAALRLITEVPTSTGPVWIMTLIPLYTLVVGLLMLLSGAAETTSTVALVLMFGVPYLAGIVLAFLDYRTLRRAGLEQPAPWAFAILTVGIYLVARLTRTLRESGTGFGPLFTFLALGLSLIVANVAVPGLIIQLAPASFAHQAEIEITQSGAALGIPLVATCPPTPPLIPLQSFVCQAHKPGGATYDVTVSLQRSNGWISWRVDDWGVFSTAG